MEVFDRNDIVFDDEELELFEKVEKVLTELEKAAKEVHEYDYIEINKEQFLERLDAAKTFIYELALYREIVL